MRFTRESERNDCDCRSAGECRHDVFAELESLQALVDSFADEMMKKLRKKYLDGYKGWDDPAWTRTEIVDALMRHLKKGDPVDIANFAAFIWNRENE